MSTKVRKEVPKIVPKRPQTFMLTHEELAQAAANFVINHRTNCVWHPHDDYIIISDPTEFRITLKETPK